MKRIHADLKAKDFEKPSGITQAVVCLLYTSMFHDPDEVLQEL